MSKQSNNKRTYKAPRLLTYGTVRQLTQATYRTVPTLDGALSTMTTTMMGMVIPPGVHLRSA